jgi:hypothetical protein
VLLHGEVPAVVNGVTIYHDYVTYKVAWINDGSRYEVWVSDHEIAPEGEAQTGVIGFHRDGA